MPSQTTFLEEGDGIYIGIIHSDGSVSRIRLSRDGDRLYTQKFPAEGHDPDLRDLSISDGHWGPE